MSTTNTEVFMAKSVVAKLKTLIATAPKRRQRKQKEHEIRQKALFEKAVKCGLAKLYAHAESKAKEGLSSFNCNLRLEEICSRELSILRHNDVMYNIAQRLKLQGFHEVEYNDCFTEFRRGEFSFHFVLPSA